MYHVQTRAAAGLSRESLHDYIGRICNAAGVSKDLLFVPEPVEISLG